MMNVRLTVEVGQGSVLTYGTLIEEQGTIDALVQRGTDGVGRPITHIDVDGYTYSLAQLASLANTGRKTRGTR